MKRADFLRGIVGFLGIAALPQGIVIRQYQRIYLLQSFVRGFCFYEGMSLMSGMKEGDLLELVREPGNEHDPCAIAVYFNQSKIGFLPREDNELLSKLMDADIVPLHAEITHLKIEAKAWEQVHVAVYVLKPNQKPLPESAIHLTIMETPQYCSLKLSKDQVVQIYYDDHEDMEYVMDAEAFYEEMVVHSRNDGIYDILHQDFGAPEVLAQAITEGRIIVNKNSLPEELLKDNLLNAIKEGALILDHCFDEKGYVVANVGRVAQLSDRLEKVALIKDKLGRVFYEVIFR